MKNLPLVSVVVPTYNDRDTIEASLRTILRQSYPQKEVIVVNDGSTDDTLSVLHEMKKEYPLLQLISTEHIGLTKARNTGIKNSKGEIVFFGESDAVYSREYLSKAVDLLTKKPELGGVCLTGAPWIVKSTFVTECIDVENRIQRKLLESGQRKPFYAWVYLREAIRTVGGFDIRLFQAEDRDIFLRVKKAGYPIGLVNGINWRHIRNQNIRAFAKRNYDGGMTRLIFLIKHRKVLAFFRSVGLLWSLFFAFPLSFFFPWLLYIILLAMSLPVIYKLIFTLRFGWSCVKKKKYLFLIPLFSALRHISSAFGYTHSAIIFVSKKLRNKPAWGWWWYKETN